MRAILVVCEGNLCRSPMAQGLLAAALQATRTSSAGLNALSGLPADETAVRLMRARGIDISAHRAIQVNRAMCDEAELVLVMSKAQKTALEQTYPTTCGRVFRIAEHANVDVPDPYRQPESVFRDALELIADGVHAWVRRIRRI